MLARKGAKSRTLGHKLRSTGTKARARVAHGRGSIERLQQQLEARTCELAEAQRHADEARRQLAEARRQAAEALEQHTATSEVLQVISSSSGELQPVFDAMLANATRICEAKFGTLYLRDGDTFHAASLHNAPPAFAEDYRKRGPIGPGPATVLGRLIRTKQVVHLADATREKAYIEGDPFFVTAVKRGSDRTSVRVPKRGGRA